MMRNPNLAHMSSVNVPDSDSQDQETRIESDVPDKGEINTGLQAPATTSERSPSWTALFLPSILDLDNPLEKVIWVQVIVSQYEKSYQEGDPRENT